LAGYACSGPRQHKRPESRSPFSFYFLSPPSSRFCASLKALGNKASVTYSFPTEPILILNVGGLPQGRPLPQSPSSATNPGPTFNRLHLLCVLSCVCVVFHVYCACFMRGKCQKKPMGPFRLTGVHRGQSTILPTLIPEAEKYASVLRSSGQEGWFFFFSIDFFPFPSKLVSTT